ncbi:hypothetical protein [Leucobacter tenebrionis]|uniref:hypothetical protein n=1 Tax=Leucobacter tenebrionis TaxID=2873270 RepID=UPI001CA7930F|nr:hypothetical protein [Leucobacter tenebrionis]QZY52906.1 hypothetical protein KVY00_05585 [Leucobacter tenebrionis]
MTKISPRLLEETITTAGYRSTRTGTIIHITSPDGTTVGEGTHTSTGRLRIFITPLKRHITTITELGQALDDIKEHNR